ncbi:MAG TPA: EamA family transporter [bacterium]|nr:EamA family transporter [bacterium]
MMWAIYALGSGIFNALWTARIKLKIQKEGALPFTASIRWGVVLLLLPLAILHWRTAPPRWWAFTLSSGIFESLSVWTLANGARKDYYSSYALSNITPLFVLFAAHFLLGEELTLSLGAGVGLVVGGILWLYYRGHWSWWGFSAAVIGAFSSLLSKAVIAEADPIEHACLSFFMGAIFCTAISARKKPLLEIPKIAGNVWTHRYLAVGSALATWFFYMAVFLAPLSRMSPLVRINIVVGFLLSVFHLKERHDWQGRGFGAILLLAGLILVLRK